MKPKRPKNPKTKMAFVETPESKKKLPSQTIKSPKGETRGVKEILPTKDGIYKPVPKSPSVSVSVAPKAKMKPQKKKPVQFSSQKKAVKHMRASIKAKQRRGPGSSGARRGFDK